MMYGFGDDEVPYTESVDLLEDMLIAFINEMVRIFQSYHVFHFLSRILLLPPPFPPPKNNVGR